MLQTGVRPIDAWVHTIDFGIRGRFHLRERTGSAALLNAEERPYLPMTEVEVFAPPTPSRPEGVPRYRVPFAAIPKTRITWVVGGAIDAVQDPQGRRPRTVYLLYADVVLAGVLHMRPELRLSDFIGSSVHAKPFVTLHEARMLRPASADVPLAQLETLADHEFLTVNLRQAGGVLDERDGEGSRTAR